MSDSDYRWVFTYAIWISIGVLLWFNANSMWGPAAAWFVVGVLTAVWMAITELGYAMVVAKVVAADRMRRALHK